MKKIDCKIQIYPYIQVVTIISWPAVYVLCLNDGLARPWQQGHGTVLCFAGRNYQCNKRPALGEISIETTASPTDPAITKRPNNL